jgi:hypothetical protein
MPASLVVGGRSERVSTSDVLRSPTISHYGALPVRRGGSCPVVRFYALLFAVEICLLVYCVLNVITTPEDEVRNLPKIVWLLLVLFFPLVGSIAWLACGRPQRPQRSLPYKGGTGSVPAEYDRPGRATAWSPDDDAAYLRSLKERADAQREQAEQERRQRLDQEEQERARRRSEKPESATDDT